MSLRTWKKEFYPKAAKNTSKADAIGHSLRKWIGLRRKNLAKHGLRLDIARIVDSDGHSFLIDSDSCALCKHHYHKDDSDKTCCSCPLYALLDNTRCDEDADSPYARFISGRGPESMIESLTILHNVERCIGGNDE